MLKQLTEPKNNSLFIWLMNTFESLTTTSPHETQLKAMRRQTGRMAPTRTTVPLMDTRRPHVPALMSVMGVTGSTSMRRGFIVTLQSSPRILWTQRPMAASACSGSAKRARLTCAGILFTSTSTVSSTSWINDEFCLKCHSMDWMMSIVLASFMCSEIRTNIKN